MTPEPQDPIGSVRWGYAVVGTLAMLCKGDPPPKPVLEGLRDYVESIIPEIVAEAVAKEREACAALCENLGRSKVCDIGNAFLWMASAKTEERAKEIAMQQEDDVAISRVYGVFAKFIRSRKDN